jgi:hypothetical protein
MYKKFVNGNVKTKEKMYNALYSEVENLSELLSKMSEHLATGLV